MIFPIFFPLPIPVIQNPTIQKGSYMTNEEAMAYFVDHLSDVDGIGIHHDLATFGSAGEVFKSLGAAEYGTFNRSDVEHVELPTYGRGFGLTVEEDGRWEKPGSRALTFRDWLAAVDIDKIRLRDNFQYWENPTHILDAGPSLVIRDTLFGKTVMVDGCHRALMRARFNLPIPIIIYTSQYAHMLIFPSHFVNHAIQKNKEWFE